MGPLTRRARACQEFSPDAVGWVQSGVFLLIPHLAMLYLGRGVFFASPGMTLVALAPMLLALTGFELWFRALEGEDLEGALSRAVPYDIAVTMGYYAGITLMMMTLWLRG